jgi:hypothetical protein
MLVLSGEAVSCVPPPMGYAEAIELLKNARAAEVDKLINLRVTSKSLLEEIQDLSDEDRTKSMGIRWQFRGKRSEGKFYNFEEEDSGNIEEAWQAWVDAGRSKKHSERRYELSVKTGKVTIDFHLGTQKTKGGIRVTRRQEMPSKAHDMCLGYFRSHGLGRRCFRYG